MTGVHRASLDESLVGAERSAHAGGQRVDFSRARATRGAPRRMARPSRPASTSMSPNTSWRPRIPAYWSGESAAASRTRSASLSRDRVVDRSVAIPLGVATGRAPSCRSTALSHSGVGRPSTILVDPRARHTDCRTRRRGAPITTAGGHFRCRASRRGVADPVDGHDEFRRTAPTRATHDRSVAGTGCASGDPGPRASCATFAPGRRRPASATAARKSAASTDSSHAGSMAVTVAVRWHDAAGPLSERVARGRAGGRAARRRSVTEQSPPAITKKCSPHCPA